MEMHEVRYFLAVSRNLNFTRAAEECNVAQPSLTRGIKKLEDELGGTLFRRERTLSHLTDLGQLMLPHLQRCYDSAMAAKSLAKAVQAGTVAPLRFALSSTINLHQLTPAFNALMAAMPGLVFKLHRGTGAEIAGTLKLGDCELAIAGTFDDDWERFDRWPLYEDPYALVMRSDHRLAGEPHVDLSDLAGEPVLVCPQFELERQGTQAADGIEELSSDAHQVVSEHDLIALLEAGLGVSVLPRSFGQSANLCCVPIRDSSAKRTVTLYAVAGRERSPASNTLLKLLRFADWTGVSLGRPVAGVRNAAE